MVAIKRYELLQLVTHRAKPNSVLQACQMALFQTKNHDLSKFWRVLQWKVLVYYIYVQLVYFTAIWYILWPFGVFYGVLVCCTKEKSGNPVLE
jgi:hypothetical protein